MIDLYSYAKSFIRQNYNFNIKDIIEIESVEKFDTLYEIKYKVSASGNGYDKLYISGKMVFYDKILHIEINEFNQYINELRKNKLLTLL